MAQVADKRFWFGILLVIIGGFLLLDNLYILPFYIPYYFFSWQMILIVIGLFLLLVKEKREGGTVLIVIGSVFLAPEIFDVSFRRIFEFWPVVLILVGISILLRRQGGGRWGRHETKEGESDTIDEMNILSGQKKIITNQEFKGGKITTILGGSELDMSKAGLAKQEVVLDAFALFGGNKIIVPPDWTVKFEVFSLFGGFTDERQKPTIEVVSNPEKVLLLKGTAIFGGGEIKSY